MPAMSLPHIRVIPVGLGPTILVRTLGLQLRAHYAGVMAEGLPEPIAALARRIVQKGASDPDEPPGVVPEASA
ncbi:MAG TPA: hypothetical protein VIL09_12750 [Microvirga sp.]|jgi:hypothetical protein